MFNVTQKLSNDKKKLVLEVDLTSDGRGASASGKNIIIATSEGNQQIDGMPTGWKFGINLWKPKAQ